MIADPLAFIRAAHFAATLMACGSVFFAAIVIRPSRAPPDSAVLRARLNVLVWSGLGLSILTGAMWLVWLASNILGESIADVSLHGGAWSVLTDTRFGWICCLRLALALLLGLLMLHPEQRVIAVVAGAVFLASPAIVSHAGAIAGPRGDMLAASDAVHLLAAGVWLGGLPAFVLLLWTASRRRKPDWDEFTIQATKRFSSLATLAVGALVVTGILNSWNLLGGLRDLWTTNYGRLIGFKIVLLAAMLAIAIVNKFHLTPRLPGRSALGNLQRNSLAEMGIGLCVLILVGYLGRIQPTAHVHPASTAVPPEAAFAHIHMPEVMADVTINPGRVGPSAITIRVSREDFTIFAAKDVRLTLDPPAGIPPIERQADRQPDETWTIGDIVLPQSGIWTVRVIVIAQSGNTIVLDAPILIER
jgi:putative copper resistance protein D